MLHPATVHFAIVLPIVASVFSLIYLYTRSESMSKISTRTLLVAAIAMIAVWYTGNQAGPEIFNDLSKEGQKELLEHKQLGLYLAIGISIIALLKAVACKMKKFGLELLAILLLLGVTATTLLQGKHGGEIVYEYGMPFQTYMLKDSLKDLVSEISELEDGEEKLELYEDTLDEIVGMEDDDEEEE